MRERILDALKHSKADFTEIRVEEREVTRVSYRGKDLEDASATLDTGGFVRCLVRKNGWGVATFNNLDDLLNKVDQAYQCALVGKTDEPIELAEVEPVQETISVPLSVDFRDISMAEKKAVAEKHNQIIQAGGDQIVDTVSAYRDIYSRIVYANSQGTLIEEERPNIAVVAMAVARDGGNVQQAFKGNSGPFGFDFVRDQERIPREATRLALDLLKASPVKGGEYTVVADNILASVFIHEAFGHLSEADFIYENPKAREMMVLGRRFGKDILNVYDDGTIPGQVGTHKYDDEGTLSRHNDLIREGVLVGRLHSRQTASKLGEKPTGNARALNYRFPPIVRMTNTAIAPGTTPFEDMIKDIKLGVYACDAYGGQTALENFSFSSGHAYMIRDGKIAEMVKDVILAGNLFTTLQNIDAIGNDFKWCETGMGGCGKANQGPLPVGMGAPHIRIQNVVIGGE